MPRRPSAHATDALAADVVAAPARNRTSRTPSNGVTMATKVSVRKQIPRDPIVAECWEMYDQIGELRFAATYLRNMLERCRLVPARITADGDPQPLADDDVSDDANTVREFLSGFAGGQAGQSGLLGSWAVHATVAGDSYLIGELAKDASTSVDPGTGEVTANWSDYEWILYSSEEIQYSGGEYKIRTGRATRILAATAIVVRVWRPHPKLRDYADSPTRAVLPVLRELVGYTQHVLATVQSRMAGNGLLLLPQGLTFPLEPDPSAPDGDGAQRQHTPDEFMRTLIAAISTAIKDRESAAAVTPIVAFVPDAALGKSEHIKLGTGFDERLKENRDDAIKRFAIGMDLPAEIVLGLGGSNHWSAWQIEESAVKLHGEPLLSVFVNAITEGIFRPGLESLGIEDPESWAVWYDTADLRLRPNRSDDAQKLAGMFAVNFEALRREAGFSEEDAPDDEELARMVLLKLATTQPTLAPALLPLLGLPAAVPIKVTDTETGEPDPTAPEPADGPPAQDTTGDASGADGEPPAVTSAIVAVEELVPAGLEAAADVLVFRALERAGSKLRGQSRSARAGLADVPTWEIHMHLPARGCERGMGWLLEEAWVHVPALALRHGWDAAGLTVALDAYVTRLLDEGTAHEPGAILDVLANPVLQLHAAVA